MGVPPKWRVYKGKSHLKMDDLGVISGNLHVEGPSFVHVCKVNCSRWSIREGKCWRIPKPGISEQCSACYILPSNFGISRVFCWCCFDAKASVQDLGGFMQSKLCEKFGSLITCDGSLVKASFLPYCLLLKSPKSLNMHGLFGKALE